MLYAADADTSVPQSGCGEATLRNRERRASARVLGRAAEQVLYRSLASRSTAHTVG